MKTLADLLSSLSHAERDFISNLDYSQEVTTHRRQLDVVIENAGKVDLETQYWHPYEVIELGKNHFEQGHELEFVACNGIVLLNIASGTDKNNEPQRIISSFLTNESKLDPELVTMIKRLAKAAILVSEGQDGPPP